MNIVKICNRIIEYSFYALFFFVPLVLAGDTSELFEFNKMWLAFGLGLVIFAAWSSKAIIQEQLKIQRTPLDIPIMIFFASQFISTLFSWDQHVSIWGYYSRFNGGLLSTILYIFLYYAFSSNLLRKSKTDATKLDLSILRKVLKVSLLSGIVVALWGIPSHFGYDPTCLLFRGTLDVACWANDFQPKNRIFSTLGQPDWLAAYMAILIPITVALLVNSFKSIAAKTIKLAGLSLSVPEKLKLSSGFYTVCIALFYLSLLYSKSRSGIIAIWVALAIVFAGYIFINKREQIKLFIPGFLITLFILITFYAGTPFGFLNSFSLSNIQNKMSSAPPPSTAPQPAPVKKPAPLHTGEFGGTDSSKIRLLVWEGGLNAWKENPLFGTGLETFAFAYYKYKPAGQNMTSEWNFLYNKAHNEFLNYLVTSGLFGLGSYLAIIGMFLFISGKKLLKDKHNPDSLLVIGFIAAFIGISITNFFGFSVVIVNSYFFLIPVFVFAIQNLINSERKILIPKSAEQKKTTPSAFQWAGISAISLACLYLLYNLLNYWNADKAFSYGANLNKIGYYQDAYSYLQKAVAQRPGEPVFQDELAVNNAALASQLLTGENAQNASASAETASTLSQQAISTSDKLVTAYPKNFVFWKSRIRIFYTLAQINPSFLSQALLAARSAQVLAPNDASITYNLGVIEGQTGNIDNGITALEKTVEIKPDYADARHALGLFYDQKALDTSGKVVDRSYIEKAKEQMRYLLSNINAKDTRAQETLKQLEKK